MGPAIDRPWFVSQKTFRVPGRPGTRNIFLDTAHDLSIEVRMIKTCFFDDYFQRINLQQSPRVRIPVILYFSQNLPKSVKILNPGDENW